MEAFNLLMNSQYKFEIHIHGTVPDYLSKAKSFQITIAKREQGYPKLQPYCRMTKPVLNTLSVLTAWQSTMNLARQVWD